MDKKEPPQAGDGRKPKAENAAPDQPATPPDDGFAKVKAVYQRLFPAESPQAKYGPLILVAALFIVLLLAKCAVSSVGEKITTVTKARAEEARVRATGVLVVKSNRPEATVEAVLVASAGTPATDPAKGALGQALPNLPPGKYAVTVRADGWPDAHGEVDVPAGQQTEVTVNFKTGSLRLDTDPTGATVKQGKTMLGKTPLVIPQLPPGDVPLVIEYPSWPAVTYQAAIAENVEAAATVRLPHGRLTVDSVPAGATVVLEGKAYKQTPLFFDPVSAGPKKLTVQAKDFPPLEVSVTVVDREEVKVRPVLGTVFPVLDPAELLRNVWLAEDPNRVAPAFNATTGIYRPKNDVVKNIHRETLYRNWQRKFFRYSGPVKAYDAASGRVEFADQKSELSRYRVVAQAKPGANPGVPPGKDATVSLYGRLTAVEEPVWPGRVITLELSDADFLPEGTP